MNGRQFLAHEFAKLELVGDQEFLKEKAYLAGFTKALKMASGLVLSLENPKTRGLSVLISAIGRAEVDGNGRRIVDLEDERLPS